jgi:polysaccharide biosynthesis protein PslG
VIVVRNRARRPQIMFGLLSVSLLGLVLNITTLPVSLTTSSSGAMTLNKPLLGMSVPTLVNQSASQQAVSLANMRSIGLGWVRVDANWSIVQPTGPSSFDWSGLDQEVSSMRAAGMNIDLIIDDTPAWARDPSASGNWGQPASASAFVTFAGQVAARYGPRGVRTYEIWNEPNIQPFWNPAPNPGLYTTMLRGSYATIKAVQSNATVLSGGLAPSASDGTNITPVTFLEDMYADGAKGSFDALGYHAYSFPALPDTFASWSGWSQMNQTNPSLRSVMTANGDAGKQIWITEIGAPSSGPNGVGTTAQAEEVTQAVQGAQRNPWIGAEFFYTYQDATSNPDYYGLLNADGSPKPAWTALAARLGGPPSAGILSEPAPVVLLLLALALGGLAYGITRRRALRRRRQVREGGASNRRTSLRHRGRHERRRGAWWAARGQFLNSSASDTTPNSPPILSGTGDDPAGSSPTEPGSALPVEHQPGQVRAT